MQDDGFWEEYNRKSKILLEDLERYPSSVEFNFALGLLTRIPTSYNCAKKILWLMLKREELKITPQGNLMAIRRTRVDGTEELIEAIHELVSVVARSDGPVWEVELLDSVGMSEQLARTVLNLAVRDGFLERTGPSDRSSDYIKRPS